MIPGAIRQSGGSLSRERGRGKKRQAAVGGRCVTVSVSKSIAFHLVQKKDRLGLAGEDR